MSEPIYYQDVIIAKLVAEGKRTDEIISIFKEHGYNIDRKDVKKGTELTFWMNIPNAIKWNDIK